MMDAEGTIRTEAAITVSSKQATYLPALLLSRNVISILFLQSVFLFQSDTGLCARVLWRGGVGNK